MCVGLDWRVAYLAHQRPSLDMQVKKAFTPTTEEDPNYRAFFRDCQGLEKVLVYGGQSVYQRFKGDYDAIAEIEEMQGQVARAVDSPENQKLYDDLNDELINKTAQLKEKIKIDFTEFVAEKLGHDRFAIAPEIFYRFSQKAFTSLNTVVSEHTEKTLSKIFHSKTRAADRCELIFTDSPKYPVKIVATSRGVFEQYRPKGKLEMHSLHKPIDFAARAEYSIGTDEVTTGAVAFSLKEQPKR
ncbi:MAG: hypothetical protein K1X28_08365 [Parachlamydiales bacterium]|nr:hypothetical protein [Parachlamydiales bacterium]